MPATVWTSYAKCYRCRTEQRANHDTEEDAEHTIRVFGEVHRSECGSSASIASQIGTRSSDDPDFPAA